MAFKMKGFSPFTKQKDKKSGKLPVVKPHKKGDGVDPNDPEMYKSGNVSPDNYTGDIPKEAGPGFDDPNNDGLTFEQRLNKKSKK